MFFTYRNTIKVIDFLKDNGFVENHPGRYGRKPGKSSFRSRMRATSKLVDLLTVQHKIEPEYIEKDPYTECIILRDVVDDKKVDIVYTDTPETKRMRRDLLTYNNPTPTPTHLH